MYLLFILLIFSTPAYAYIDVGIGSMLVQGLVALLMFIPFYFRKMLKFFKKNKKEENGDE